MTSAIIMASVPASLLLLTATAISHPSNDFTWDYLQKHKDGIVFVSSCTITPRHKAVMIVPSNSDQGWYAIIQDHRMSIELGAVGFGKGTWTPFGFSNGIGVQEPNARVANYLMESKFVALAARNFKKIFEDTPRTNCPRISRDTAENR
jgi:hypothetical protein